MDASAAGLGAILYQNQAGKNRVIAYASRTLKPSEKNYHSTKLEFLAMKWAIIEQFKNDLSYADQFKVYTDNNPLLFVMGLSKPNATIQRWVSEVAEYNFTIHYRPGSINRDADCLSRLPLDVEIYMPLCQETTNLDAFQTLVASAQASTGSITAGLNHVHPHIEVTEINSASLPEYEPLLNLKEDQAEDEYIKPIIEIMNGGSKQFLSMPSLSKRLLREKRKLYLDDKGILRRKTKEFDQIVLPLKHRQMIFQTLHTDMGHLGSERVLKLARQRAYWPKMQSDIEEFTQKRCRCLAQRKARQQAVAPLVSIPSSSPMELVAIDFLHLEKVAPNTYA